MNVTVGHTPDADDAFMFYGMLEDKIDEPQFNVSHVIQDIEALNRRAIAGDLDVTAISVHAYAHISEYTILRSGGSFGLGYGPVVVAPSGFDPDSLANSRIAIPGTMTSAFLLLRLMLGTFEYTEMPFDEIPEAVKNGRVDAGLVIHEAQISYPGYNLEKVLDLGEWWDKTTGGLPVPLGINVMKSSLGDQTIKQFDIYLRKSIQYGLEHRKDAIRYAMQYARDNSTDLVDRFVRMYVNPVTVNMGDNGETSIRRFFDMANDADLIPEFNIRIS